MTCRDGDHAFSERDLQSLYRGARAPATLGPDHFSVMLAGSRRLTGAEKMMRAAEECNYLPRRGCFGNKVCFNRHVVAYVHRLFNRSVLDALVNATPQVDLIRDTRFHFKHDRSVIKMINDVYPVTRIQ